MPVVLCLCLYQSSLWFSLREEIEKQKARARYLKMHFAGKSDEAKADLARLAIIKKDREEAAKKKEEERKGRLELDYVPVNRLLFEMFRLCINEPPDKCMFVLQQRKKQRRQQPKQPEDYIHSH